MARIDRDRFAVARFPMTITIPTRFDDLDTLGHINNAAAVVILQEARARFDIAAGVPHLRGDLRTMVAGLTVEFAGEMHYPEPIEISTGVVALGRTSFRLAQVARQDGRTCLYSEATMVLGDADGPAPMPDALRAAFERVMIGDRDEKG